MDLNFDRTLFGDSSSRSNKTPGVINCNHLAYTTAHVEREASDAAAEVERASAFLEWKKHAFAIDPLMKSQQDILEMVQAGTKIFWFAVMKKEILVEVTIGFVGIGLHMATCLTNSVVW